MRIELNSHGTLTQLNDKLNSFSNSIDNTIQSLRGLGRRFVNGKPWVPG